MRYDDDKLNTIFDKTGGSCHLCGKQLSWNNYGNRGARGAWHVDHSVPLAKGGTHHMNNLYPACISCNEEKGTLHKTTIRKRKGYQTESDDRCFITTACIRSKGLSDECRELQILRSFRDNYIASVEGGTELINEYYKTAPLIVQKINSQANANEIYSILYGSIEKAVALVERKMYPAAFALYCNIVRDLKKEYLAN